MSEYVPNPFKYPSIDRFDKFWDDAWTKEEEMINISEKVDGANVGIRIEQIGPNRARISIFTRNFSAFVLIVEYAAAQEGGEAECCIGFARDAVPKWSIVSMEVETLFRFSNIDICFAQIAQLMLTIHEMLGDSIVYFEYWGEGTNTRLNLAKPFLIVLDCGFFDTDGDIIMRASTEYRPQFEEKGVQMVRLFALREILEVTGHDSLTKGALKELATKENRFFYSFAPGTAIEGFVIKIDERTPKCKRKIIKVIIEGIRDTTLRRYVMKAYTRFQSWPIKEDTWNELFLTAYVEEVRNDIEKALKDGEEALEDGEEARIAAAKSVTKEEVKDCIRKILQKENELKSKKEKEREQKEVKQKVINLIESVFNEIGVYPELPSRSILETPSDDILETYLDKIEEQYPGYKMARQLVFLCRARNSKKK